MAKKKFHHHDSHHMGKAKEHGMSHVLHEVREREHYAGRDERRAQERADYHMITEDHHAMANLPQNVIMREYPRMRYGLDPYLDDTASGIDKQIYDDMSQMKKHISKSKY
jgi:hypothetical protein